MFLIVNKSKRLGFLLYFHSWSWIFYVGRLEGQNPATRKEIIFKRAGRQLNECRQSRNRQQRVGGSWEAADTEERGRGKIGGRGNQLLRRPLG